MGSVNEAGNQAKTYVYFPKTGQSGTLTEKTGKDHTKMCYTEDNLAGDRVCVTKYDDGKEVTEYSKSNYVKILEALLSILNLFDTEEE